MPAEFQDANSRNRPLGVRNGYELCVLCGEVTDVRYETPVDIRKNYVQGCGQLCNACGADLRKTR